MDRPDPDIEREAIAVLEDALDQPSDQRYEFVRSRETLRNAVRDRAIELLEASTSPSAGILTGGASAEFEDEPIPEQIGAYRIMRLIGRGGMGNVYLAERAEDDFDHAVAIKVIKRRLITTHIIERFRSERQILANLNHPNIARLFDGGETESGAPYFVMEFVDGQPLSHWLRTEERPVSETLAVFGQVCSAVQAAHQRLIIHRDLTPPNILVAEHDVVKVIDFGIARSESSVAEATGSSREHTPGFAAPEQRKGRAPSTLSDIYALGRLLKLVSSDGENLELDAIAAKAASEEPSERYQSVSALIADLNNFSAQRPVSAMNGGVFYAATKLAQRQTALFLVSTLSLIALLGALVTITQAYRQAELAQAEAEENLADTRALASTMIFEVFDEVSDRPGNSEARLLLARNARQYLEEIASDPKASPASRLAAGRGFYRLATATGTFGASNRGDIFQGIAFYERSIEILESLHSGAPDDDVAVALARSHVSLSRDKLASYTDFAGAVYHAERARAVLLPIKQPSAEALAELGKAERHLGDALACCNNRVEDGQRAIERGLDRLAAAPHSIRKSPAVQRSYNDLRNLSAGFAILNDGDAAGIEIFSTVLIDQRALVAQTDAAEDYRLEATIASNLARTLLRMGESEAAMLVMSPTHEKTLRSYNADPLDNDLQRRLAITSIVMGRIAAEKGDRREATQLADQGLSLARESEGSSRNRTLPALNYAHRLHEAAQVYLANGQMGETCRLSDEAVKIYTQYAEVNELPITSLRYRLAPLRQIEDSCS